jgi:cyclopropane-fatty-acyl-phospholipid synthase
LSTQEANEQHYEVPAKFFELVLDQKFLKYSFLDRILMLMFRYSCCHFGIGENREKPITTLEEAAEAMLSLYLARAQVVDGMAILDLGR